MTLGPSNAQSGGFTGSGNVDITDSSESGRWLSANEYASDCSGRQAFSLGDKTNTRGKYGDTMCAAEARRRSVVWKLRRNQKLWEVRAAWLALSK
jgi:hypothetical protein